MPRDLDYRPCERRGLQYWSPDKQRILCNLGDEVYSICKTGVIVAIGKSRILIPWNRIIDLSWDVNDTLTETLHKL